MNQRRIAQPITQVRLTNVAYIRLKRAGTRFEIACYKNKVVNWRNKVETDIDEVLQIHRVFTNVSKGIVAKKADMEKAFGTSDQQEVCKILLDKGELQISDKERQVANENTFRDIATIVASKCVNPESNRPYTFSTIERVMKEAHYSCVPNKSAKQQALEVIKLLKDLIPIERAKMKVKITVPEKSGNSIRETLQKLEATILEQNWDSNVTFLFLMDPGAFREINAAVKKEQRGSSSLEVVELNCQQEGDHSIDDAVEMNSKRSGKDESKIESKEVAISMPPPAPIAAEKPKGLTCKTCGGDFGEDRNLYRQHFRSDWHRYNLKLKGKKLPVIGEQEFNAMDQEEIESFFEKLMDASDMN